MTTTNRIAEMTGPTGPKDKASRNGKPMTTTGDVNTSTLLDVTATPPAPTPKADIPDTPTNGNGPSRQLEMDEIMDGLRHAIHSVGVTIVGWNADRGRFVAKAIDVGVRTAENTRMRSDLRASALRKAQSVAEDAYDPKSEPVPNVENWNKVYRLVSLIPSARSVHSVASALALATMLTRDESGNATGPETWSVKLQYRDGVAERIVAATVADRLDHNQVRAAIRQADGLTIEETAKVPADPIKAAHTYAAQIVDRINDGKVNPETLFDTLRSILAKYGYEKTI